MKGSNQLSLSLVILAAGNGTRFGGNKPLAAVGPSGQSLFEYSVHDAYKAGFKQVVFVVNDQQDTSDFSCRLENYGDNIDIDFVIQDLASGVKPGNSGFASILRTKPWGTAHAVLVCREKICNPFVVINADDYYGCENFEVIGHYLLRNSHNPQLGVLPGYKLENTLSISGGVNRGICSVDPEGYLESIQEVRNISLDQELLLHVDQADGHATVEIDSIVSMTFWGFNPSVFNIFESAFQAFLDDSTDLVNDECYIPDAVDLAIKSGLLKVKVFKTSEIWKGLTYIGDMTEVRDFISALSEAGAYPN